MDEEGVGVAGEQHSEGDCVAVTVLHEIRVHEAMDHVLHVPPPLQHTPRGQNMVCRGVHIWHKPRKGSGGLTPTHRPSGFRDSRTVLDHQPGGGVMSEAFREIAGKSQKNYGIYSKNGDKLISGVYTFVLQGRGGRNVQGMA